MIERGVSDDSCLHVLWPPSPNASHINILYGEYDREFEHALRDYPNAGGSADICGLKNGVNYKFIIQATADGGKCASGWSGVQDPLP